MIVAITFTLWGEQTELQWDFLCDWGVTPPLLLCLLIDPLPLSLSQSLCSRFHRLSCSIFSFVSSCSHSLLPPLSSSFTRLMNLKLGGIVWPGETSSLFGPYFLLHNVFTPWSAGGIQLSITLPQVPANTFTTFKLATVTANHALASCVSRCCRLLFF